MWKDGGPVPYHGAPVALSITTFARAKNDVRLGPLFTDSAGVLMIGRRELDVLVADVYSSGVMDYMPIEDAFPLVEISHYASADIARMIHAREHIWTRLLAGEAAMYASMPEFLHRLRTAGNHQLEPPAAHYGRLRDEWTDPARHAEYTYFVVPARSSR